MGTSHQFGGHWTQDKLNRLRKYLQAYLQIFKKNPKASRLHTTYVDAFAGTGRRALPSVPDFTTTPIFPDEEDVKSFQQGSAWIALDLDPSFDQYLFIEQNPEHAQQLKQLRLQFAHKSAKITIRQGDANQLITEWCEYTDWYTHRAVVFLDPYGMEVQWTTIEAIARTQAIDLWILFPPGQAVNRILTRKHPPEGAWADRLTMFFGTDDWRMAFYQKSPQISMFDEDEAFEKTANFETIGTFFADRLKHVFAGVADNPLPLYNSKHVPIYLLCFAAGNPKGARTAVKIAQDILRQ